ncbi:MAG TPA: type I-E CRISPR-associated protein Cas6/Cse3/CasE [Dehalococcoidia bacterium]
MSEQLHLVRLVFQDPLRLYRFARAQGLPAHPFDADYAVHCALGRLFGEEAPQPFVQRRRGRATEVLAYATADGRSLEAAARSYAPPEAWCLVDWEQFASKPMPARWPAGTRLGFETRVVPVVRGPRGHGVRGPVRTARPEVDAYLAAIWQTEEPPAREDVYRRWLERELARDGAAGLVAARVEGFRLRRLLRRDGQRAARTITRPEVWFRGTLVVRDGEAFAALLARGLGRHRAFGFGMVLLLPEGRGERASR